MTLTVNVYELNSADGMDIIEPESHSEEFAGFESWRKTAYGSRTSQSLDLQLLSSLATKDVYAKGADLQRLQAEVEKALGNLTLFAEEAGAYEDALRFRFENILKAVRKAIHIGGGVVIW